MKEIILQIKPDVLQKSMFIFRIYRLYIFRYITYTIPIKIVTYTFILMYMHNMFKKI